MKLTANRDTVATILDRCRRVADSRSTMPILANALISATGERATFAATDLYLSTHTALDVGAVPKAGSVAVNARDLLDRVKQMPAGDITIEVDEHSHVTITAAGTRRRYRLPGVSGDDFPALPTAGEPTHTIAAPVLLRLLGETAHAISTDETRLHLNSLLVEVGEHGIRCVSTDGHRLAWSCHDDAAVLPAAKWLIPLKGAAELRRIAEAAGDGELRFGVSGPALFVLSGDATTSIKLTDAQFPPYEQVIPKSSTATVRTDRAAFANAVRAVALAASDRTGGVRLAFGPGKIGIATESPEGGEGGDELAADCDHTAIVGVQARYLLDVCAAMACDEIAIGVSGELDPLTVVPATAEDSWESGHVVMPCRI
jgi:DNA polymerase III subunit beta